MDENQVRKLLEFAIIALSKHQSNLFESTNETHQSEWNIAHHYANEVSLIFKDHDCDVEMIKPNYDTKRPDIIIHKRGTHERNFLVIEVKRDVDGIPTDIDKIKDWWFRTPLKYEYGAVVMLKDFVNAEVYVIKN
jgi:hypothetical protein